MRIPPFALFLGFGLFVGTSVAHAQVQVDWVRTCNVAPTGHEGFRVAKIAPSGAVYAVGQTGPLGTGPVHDVLVEKFDAAGNSVWIRTWDNGFPGGYMDYANTLEIEPGTESVYVVGRADAQTSNGVVLKYDSAGNLLWAAAGPTSMGEFSESCLTPAGNLAVLGNNAQGFGVVEYDAQGNQLWSNVEPLGGDYPSNIASDTNGDIIICGAYYPSGGGTDFGVTRFSANGAFLWHLLLSGGGTGYQVATSLLVDGAGSTYVGGRMVAASGVQEALVKFDAAGTLLWTALHKGTETDPTLAVEAIDSLSLTANGNIRTAGSSTNVGSGRDMQVLEYTPGGVLAWESTWDSPGNGNEYISASRVEPDGSSTVLGYTFSGSGVAQTLVASWDAHGNPRGAEFIDLSVLGPSVALAGTIGDGGTRVFFSMWPPTSADTDGLVVQVQEQSVSYCFGDGTSGACPCANVSPVGEGRGCANSQGGSARLSSAGLASLAADGLVLTSAGELPTSSSVFVQGDSAGLGSSFGDGILCMAAPIHRMFVHAASGGVVSAPAGADLSLSARSAALGDPIAAGATRVYQVVYRDPALGFCPPPSGSSYNISSALSVTWAP